MPDTILFDINIPVPVREMQDFMDMELLSSFKDVIPFFFCTGFAFATLLILITFGIFKAFSLIRIGTGSY